MNFLKELHLAGEITLIEERLENIDLNMFTILSENDILFIDSSHVLKLDSDVMFYFTKIFPLLNKGVLIHIHDIFFPYDYPLPWIKEGRFWNEQYLLEAILSNSNRYEVIASLNFLKHNHFSDLKRIAPYLTVKNEPGSIYLKVVN
jgi:hypothetical protein